MAQPSSKKQRTLPAYELLYHPTIPGRGEFIRLALEATGTPYTDVSNKDIESGYATVQQICMNQETTSSADNNPPIFAPPALRIPSGDESNTAGGGALIISQTPNILLYLGSRLGLAGSTEAQGHHVHQVALTALDLCDEAHDSHHPVASSLYYEDQKPEALKKARDLRASRLPKFLSYFARNLEFNRVRAGGEGKFLVGAALTYADTTVWQVLDGLMFAFPREMDARKDEFPELLRGFYESVAETEGVKEYLASGRRLPYGTMGIFRNYPELDRE